MNGSALSPRGPSPSCHFVPNFVAVDPERRDDAVSILEDNGVTIGEVIDSEFDPETLERVGTLIGLIRVDVDDPHEVVEAVKQTDDGIRVSVVHGLGFLGHARVMSGKGPECPPSAEEHAPVIAVVDSGIVHAEALPIWMQNPSVSAQQEDIEVLDNTYDPMASHGTFVVSQIRLAAPEHAVFVAKAQVRELPSREDPHEQANAKPTSEIDVADAVLRLIDRLQGEDREVAALNLSLGAHSDGEREDDFLLTVRFALHRWMGELGTPIFAAGGNSTDLTPVYPASWEGVTGVGAIDDDGVDVVWDQTGTRVTLSPTDRPWVEERAVGVNRVGLSGNPECPIVVWSGSSFATAEATARAV